MIVRRGRVAQWSEHLLYTQGVAGSTPASPTKASTRSLSRARQSPGSRRIEALVRLTAKLTAKGSETAARPRLVFVP